MSSPLSPRPRWPWITLIVLEIIQLLSLLPWVLMAGLAVMAFDAPGSTEKWEPWAFVLGVWSYPLWLVLAGIISWLLFIFRWYKSAVVLCALFTLPMPVLLLVILVGNS